jgi:hypothetical protein
MTALCSEASSCYSSRGNRSVFGGSAIGTSTTDDEMAKGNYQFMISTCAGYIHVTRRELSLSSYQVGLLWPDRLLLTVTAADADLDQVGDPARDRTLARQRDYPG